MLIGKEARRPNREKIRNIKEALGTALSLPEETAVTVTELTCLEEGCVPIETVVALLQPNAPPRQHPNEQRLLSSLDVMMGGQNGFFVNKKLLV